MADENATTNNQLYKELTAEIVSAYVGHNAIGRDDLPKLIVDVHASLRTLNNNPSMPEKQELTPAVPIKKSVTLERIICLEDGKKFKSIKRHLSSAHGLTPDQYRERWNLPSDYPLVALGYSETRSKLAKSHGLGRKR
jgi:predicted transcriptional regulator